MNRTAHPSLRRVRRVGEIDNRIDVERRDICLDDDEPPGRRRDQGKFAAAVYQLLNKLEELFGIVRAALPSAA
jgi:hypothetical protein